MVVHLRNYLFGGSLLFCANLTLGQQSWTAAGLLGHPTVFNQVWADGDDAIYYAGAVWENGGNALMRYADGGWSRLGQINGYINSVLIYHDTLLVGGSFDWQDLVPAPATCVKWWDGSAWQVFGEFPQNSIVRKLRVIDDTLYAAGVFYCPDTTACNGLMRWGQEVWASVGQFPAILPGGIIQLTDLVEHNGTLVGIGNVDFDNGRSIAYLDGDQWKLLEPGILGGFAGPHTLAVYQGDLYVGGQIPLSAGNPGQEIMRWNGTAFEGLGLGLQIAQGNFSSFCDVRAMVVHDGLLFIGGGCNYAGGLESRGVAVWDGTGWCSVPGDVTSQGGAIYGMDFYRDTLFAATGWIVEGDSVNLAAKYVGASYIGTCTGPLSLLEVGTGDDFSISPNPSSGSLTINFATSSTRQISVVDAIGRVVYSGRNAGGTIDVSDWSPGLYMVLCARASPKRVIVE